MTPGEKMVWAAAFVRRYQTLIHDPLSEFIAKSTKTSPEQAAKQIVATAVEDACTAVNILRSKKLPKYIVKKFGARSDEIRFLEAMLDE